MFVFLMMSLVELDWLYFLEISYRQRLGFWLKSKPKTHESERMCRIGYTKHDYQEQQMNPQRLCFLKYKSNFISLKFVYFIIPIFHQSINLQLHTIIFYINKLVIYKLPSPPCGSTLGLPRFYITTWPPTLGCLQTHYFPRVSELYTYSCLRLQVWLRYDCLIGYSFCYILSLVFYLVLHYLCRGGDHSLYLHYILICIIETN